MTTKTKKPQFFSSLKGDPSFLETFQWSIVDNPDSETKREICIYRPASKFPFAKVWDNGLDVGVDILGADSRDLTVQLFPDEIQAINYFMTLIRTDLLTLK